jgi:hypothetical protein
VRRTLRWGFALLCDAAVFIAAWWLFQTVLDISQSDAIAIAGVVAALALAPYGWWAGLAGSVKEDEKSARNRLADVVYEQWNQAATARRLRPPEAIAVRWSQPAKPVAGPAADAAAATRFSPVPGLEAIGQEPLRSGELGDLHTVYAGLRSGRLVIAGPPGSGKSSAAVLLVLQALDHRNTVAVTDRAKVPVPVLFTLHDWDPRTQPVQDWLVSQLRQTYDGLFRGRRGARAAAALLRPDKITVILDGFDEIIEPLRPLALQALSEQAVFRLVVLSRTTEIADAARQTILEGAVAVELQNVEPTAAADYLTRVQLDPAPHRWRELTDQLRSAPSSPIARALSDPLTITLVRDTYRAGDTVGELLDFCANIKRDITREDIVDHLLDRVLRTAYTAPTAYTPQTGDPSQPRYTLATAQHTLRLIAARMSQDHTRDLAWWRIPTWTPTLPRALTIGAASGLAVWLGFGLEDTFELSGPVGYIAGLNGLASALGGMLGVWSASRNLPRTAPTRWHYVFSHPSLVFVLGLVFGFLFQDLLEFRLSAWFGLWLRFHIGTWLVLGLAVGLGVWVTAKVRPRTPARWRLVFGRPAMVFALGLGLSDAVFFAAAEFDSGGTYVFGLIALLGVVLGLRLGLGRSGEGSVSALTPLASWGRWRAGGLGVWFGLGLPSALLVLEGFGLIFLLGPGAGAGFGFACGLMLGLIYPETWTTSLACAQLAIRQRTPLQLMRFLDDARERGVLRTVGPVYQFRHARLQDRLAKLDSTTPAAEPFPELAGLDDVDPATAADYLECVQCDPIPDQWRELINRLRSAPASPLAQALSNPLTLSLVRDNYRDGDSVREFLDFCDTAESISREAVEDHMLDRVLEQAYRKRPDHPRSRYSLDTAKRTLGLIASRLRQDSPDPHRPGRDLAWWRIPTWTPTLPRALTIGAASGLSIWLGFGLLYRSFWLTFFGNLVGLSSGLGGVLGAWLASKKTLQTAPARWRLMFSHPSLMFVAGVVFGFMFAFDITGVIPTILLVGVCYGLLAGLAIWLLAGLAIWLAGLVIRLTGNTYDPTALGRWRSVRSPPVVFGFALGFIGADMISYRHVSVSALYLGDLLVGLLVLGAGLRIGLGSLERDSGSPPLLPFASWNQHRVAGLGIWFVLGGLIGGFLVRAGIRGWGVLSYSTPHAALTIFLGIGLMSGLMLGLIYPETWTTSLACAQLAIRQRTPLQLMRFLDDARERGVLRTVGPVYQFRHARLQDRLAEQNITPTATISDAIMPAKPGPPRR